MHGATCCLLFSGAAGRDGRITKQKAKRITPIATRLANNSRNTPPQSRGIF
jgi:hypothetical protein